MMTHSICPICDQGTLKKEIKDEVFEYKGETAILMESYSLGDFA